MFLPDAMTASRVTTFAKTFGVEISRVALVCRDHDQCCGISADYSGFSGKEVT